MTEDEMVGWHHRLNGQNLSKLQELEVDREDLLEESLAIHSSILPEESHGQKCLVGNCS